MFLQWLVVLCLLLTGAKAWCQSSPRLKVYKSDVFAAWDPQDWWLFPTTSISHLDFTGDTQLEQGRSLQLKAVLSKYSEDQKWIFEFGPGVNFTQIQSKDSRRSPFTGVVSGGARYRPIRSWNVGAAMEFWIGNGDQLGADNEAVTAFVGPVVGREVTILGDSLIQVGFKWMNDISLNAASVQVFLLEVQWGFPVGLRSETTNAPLASR